VGLELQLKEKLTAKRVMEGNWMAHSLMENGNESNKTSCDIYNEERYTTVAIVAASTGTLSLVASVAVILIIAIFKKYNFFIQRLILYMCISAALNSVTIMMRFARLAPETAGWNRVCIATAFIDQTTLWSLTVAVLCLTFNMLIVVVFNKDTRPLEMAYICLIYIVPLTFNWIPFLQESYGESGAWCWIRTKNHGDCSDHKLGVYLKYILWYAPHYLMLVIMLVAYAVVVINVIRKRNNWRGLYTSEPAQRVQQQLMMELVMPVLFYPLGFFILNLASLINRVYDSFHGPNYVLWMIHATFSPLQGGYIALVYVLDWETMRRLNLRELWAYLFHRRTPVNEYPTTRGFTDSYEANTISPDGSVSSMDGVKVALTSGTKEKSYGSTGSTGGYSMKSERV
jgi:hypothetical protein